ncbi:ATP-binding cassette domain-containing protein [Lacticaseibacillus rhamnosus]|uniref:ATP-binding cassette domain-containing protein n=1 Tax=Lacticaseibacillus rhamnosus TaxID=47715 RepID=UPI00302F50F0
MPQFIDKKIRTYSMGMKQRLQITLVLLVDTPIILLDEPLNGLDPTSLDIVQKAIFDLGKRGKLVIVSSHNLAELARVTDVGIFINHQHLEIEKFKDYRHLKDQYAQLLQ